jgi:rod shape-determining protein MreC
MYIRRLLPLLLLVVFSLTLMTYQSNKGRIAPFGFLSNPLNHLNALIHSFSASLKEPFRKVMLRDEENVRLRMEVNRLLLEQQGYREVFLENGRLREILSLKDQEKRYVATAQIISKGLDPWSGTAVINKGKHDGIAKDMAVITPVGLVGKVSMVQDGFAHILLMTDINFSAAVKIQETRRETILSGTGAGRCVLKYIPVEEEIKEGELVVTSGFDDLFPQDLIVGYVARVSKKGTSIFQEIEVAPSQDVTKLDEVVIVKR